MTHFMRIPSFVFAGRVAHIAYLARYLFALAGAFAAVYLFARTMGGLRRRMRQAIKPTSGYFLMTDGKNDGIVRSLPLYHTTTLGRSRSSDVRLHSKRCGRRHATIYLYDGDWFIHPARDDLSVKLNGVTIRQPVPLEHRDTLELGDVVLHFIDEQAAAADSVCRMPARHRIGSRLLFAARTGDSCSLASSKCRSIDRLRSDLFSDSRGFTCSAPDADHLLWNLLSCG